MKTLGLYIHIPFCKAKCGYCDFNSYAGKESYIESYFSALLRELEIMSEKYHAKVDTIYFGGGTPTFVDTWYLCNVLGKVKELFEQCSNCEISVECNPGTIGYEGLKKLRDAGFNRISIGLQSADNGCLKELGRIHSFEDFSLCFENARRAGFENISLDLMYGLPNQGMEEWKSTIEKAVEFGTEHISCYSLKIEEGTPFAKKELILPDEDTVADMYEWAVDYLGERGYDRYEISNFSKHGKESLHNLKYWLCNDFLGLGAGAFSCVEDVRFSNAATLEKYIEDIEKYGDARETEEKLSEFDKMSEFVFLGLRLKEGISEKEFEKRFNLNIDEIFGKQLEKYTNMGFFIREGGKIRFSDKGFFVSNTILSDFV
ncbi:MAG: oxygen-independent coproporphyrinogen III oxidase [Clostridia bacterium]|nr:oxygen-independent coproporphyrinogen III oxidase [Clostridia bacterium]